MNSSRAITLGILSLLVATAIACSASDTPEPAVEQTPTPTSELNVPEFDAAAFAKINPNPEIRELDHERDIIPQFSDFERDRIPRDAINPVYTPKFISADEASLRPDEIVMGLSINGDARAYPVGMLRIREMVNDEVGGTPVLVTW